MMLREREKKRFETGMKQKIRGEKEKKTGMKQKITG
jgi:hypothetical protein